MSTESQANRWVQVQVDAITHDEFAALAAQRGLTVEQLFLDVIRRGVKHPPHPLPPPQGRHPEPEPPPSAGCSTPDFKMAVRARLLLEAARETQVAHDALCRAIAAIHAGDDLFHLPEGAVDVLLDLHGCAGPLDRILTQGEITRLAMKCGDGRAENGKGEA